MTRLALALATVLLASHALAASPYPRAACLAMTGDPTLCEHTR
jgi:hypothetical protein